MNKNFRKMGVYLLTIILGLSVLVGCGKNEDQEKTDDTVAQVVTIDSISVINRILGVAEAEEISEVKQIKLLNDYKDYIKVINVIGEDTINTDTNCEIDFNDGIISITGKFKIKQTIKDGQDSIVLVKDDEFFNDLNITINSNPTEDDVKKNINNYINSKFFTMSNPQNEFTSIPQQGSTDININSIYFKNVKENKSNLTVEFEYKHKDNYFDTDGYVTLLITDDTTGYMTPEKLPHVEIIKHEVIRKEATPPSIEEVKKAIPEKIRLMQDFLTSEELSDKEIDSIEVKSTEMIPENIYGTLGEAQATIQKSGEDKLVDIQFTFNIGIVDNKYVINVDANSFRYKSEYDY